AGTSPPAAAPIDAPPALTAVAIISEPSGAAIFVDGEPRGTSPKNLMLPAGATVQIRGELGGHDGTMQTHIVGTQAETVRLSLTPLVDAAVAADAAVDAPQSSHR
ncbi:MAG TPA: PEGA domain-containing protein, partial [Gemmatimonadaceae bacterium]|nr:PEGA domain-containing protein [Gemmatimonadaceae bacterium]